MILCENNAVSTKGFVLMVYKYIYVYLYLQTVLKCHKRIFYHVPGVFQIDEKCQDTRTSRSWRIVPLSRAGVCTWQRMQLVVMAAMLALAAAEEDCRVCQENSFSIEVEVCGRNTSILTTICMGRCETKVRGVHSVGGGQFAHGPGSVVVKRSLPATGPRLQQPSAPAGPEHV